MARPLTHTDRWRHPKYNIGYCENYGGIVYTRIAGVRRTTKLIWQESNKKRAIQILGDRIEEHINPELAVQKRKQLEPERTLFSAIEEYKVVFGKDFTKDVIIIHRRAFGYFFEYDMALDYETLYKYLAKKKNESDLAVSTKRKYLQTLARLFDFCVKRGWLMKNPVRDGVEIPKNKRTREITVLLPDEMQARLEWIYAFAPKEYHLAFRLLYGTAMRVGELLAMQCEDIGEHSFLIHGKGGIERTFTFRSKAGDYLFPDVGKTIEELKQFKQTWKGKLFSWNNPNAIQKWWVKAHLANGGTLTDGIRIHAIRRSAEYVWENITMLPFDVICDLAGHSLAVREGHYRVRRRETELQDVLAHHLAKHPAL